MLSESTYAANDAERAAIETILAPYHEQGISGSVTRIDPDETGQLRVEVIGRLRTLVFVVEADGAVVDHNDTNGRVPE